MENLLDLPEALIEKILYYTSNEDMKTIAEVAQVCKALNCTACSDSLWLRICQAKFADTDPTLWIAQASSGIAGTRSVQAPTNYRCCFCEARHCAHFASNDSMYSTCCALVKL